MSRVFETLTKATYEKKNPAKVSGTASEGDLTARFCPALQIETAFTESPSSLDRPTAREVTPQTDKLKSYRHTFPAHEHERDSEDRRDFHFKRARVAALFAAVALIAVYLAMRADYALQKRGNGANRISDLKPQSASDNLKIASKLDPIAPPAQNGKPNKIWSVQVSATPSKEIADKLAQQLKSEGYAVYVVQAEVKGQTYHRVRIGYFSVREEAEPVRESLTRHEAYRDAYLATD